MPPNADTFSHGEHDDESALHSDWGSDEANHECLGDGRPRDDQDELQDEHQPQDDPDQRILPQSGAQAPDSFRSTIKVVGSSKLSYYPRYEV